MAKLHFIHAVMNSGKSTQLLQVAHNYKEQNMNCLLLTAALDNRFGIAKITSRLGISADAETFSPDDDLTAKFLNPEKLAGFDAILIDEGQFLTERQVRDLGRCVDEFGLPVLVFGLKSNFQGRLFDGSAALMATADVLKELTTICHCGKRATHVLRRDNNGTPTLTGDQIQIGGNDIYSSLCRKHWNQAHAEVSDKHTKKIAAE
jgi:thymidine kinase